MDKIAKQILIDAKDLISIGWVQKTGFTIIDGVHHYCARGAIRRAAWDLDYSKAATWARTKLSEAINEKDIAFWNDKPERTKEEVLAAFDKAIES